MSNDCGGFSSKDNINIIYSSLRKTKLQLVSGCYTYLQYKAQYKSNYNFTAFLKLRMRKIEGQ